MKTVDEILDEAQHFGAEQRRLRAILADTELEETVKWGGPCYTWKGKNVVGIGGFKSYFGLWFHQGALLEDRSGKLINAQEGKTRALRQWRMTSAKDIEPKLIKRYVSEAMALVDAGTEITAKRDKTLELPQELAQGIRKTKGATAAYRALTPGRQREYANYVSEAKREATRLDRVEKILPMILDGVGLNDRYRKC